MRRHQSSRSAPCSPSLPGGRRGRSAVSHGRGGSISHPHTQEGASIAEELGRTAGAAGRLRTGVVSTSPGGALALLDVQGGLKTLEGVDRVTNGEEGLRPLDPAGGYQGWSAPSLGMRSLSHPLPLARMEQSKQRGTEELPDWIRSGGPSHPGSGLQQMPVPAASEQDAKSPGVGGDGITPLGRRLSGSLFHLVPLGLSAARCICLYI